MASDNRLLDQFDLKDLPPAPRGVPQIEVKFDIDVNGILSVSAKDKATGKEHSVQIKQSSGLSDEEIERMQKDAEAHAEEDKQKVALAKARNEASTLVHQTEKTLKEHEDKLDDASKAAITASCAKVTTAAEGEDPAAITTALTELAQASEALFKHMQAATEGEGGETAGATAGGVADDDIIDADFEKKA